jgi:hypothetical protein
VKRDNEVNSGCIAAFTGLIETIVFMAYGYRRVGGG